MSPIGAVGALGHGHWGTGALGHGHWGTGTGARALGHGERALGHGAPPAASPPAALRSLRRATACTGRSRAPAPAPPPPRLPRPPPARSVRVLMRHPALTPPSLPQTGSYRLPYGAPAPLTRELGELSAAFARRRCYGRGGHVWLCCRVRRRDPPHPAAVVAHRLPRRL